MTCVAFYSVSTIYILCLISKSPSLKKSIQKLCTMKIPPYTMLDQYSVIINASSVLLL